MVRHLVVDAVWRAYRLCLLLLLITAPAWLGIVTGNLPASLGVTFSLMLAYTLGPVGSIPLMGLRELRTLPTTSRDLWVSSWILAVVVVPMTLAAVRNLVAIGSARFNGSSAVSAETLFLLLVYDVVYAGALLPVGPVLGYTSHNASTRRVRWPWVIAALASFSMFLGGFALPYLVAEAIPLTFAQFTPSSIAILVVFVVMTGVSFTWTPKRGGFTPARVSGTADAGSSRQPYQARLADRLTGMPRVVWPLVAIVPLISAASFLALAGYWAIFESDVSLRSFLQGNAVLLFDTGFLPRPDGGRMWIILAVSYIATSSPWKALTRPLRILPLTTHQINALLLVTPFVQWALLWLSLIALHVAVIGLFPDALRTDLFVFLGGISALGHGLMLRYGHKGGLGVVMILGALMSFAEKRSGAPASTETGTIMVAVGLVGLALAALVNHRTLTRSTSSSKVYRPDNLFGITAPGERP